MFTDKTILLTGGTGTFGRAAVQYFLTQHPEVRRIIVYSRDEFKQYELRLAYGNHPQLKFILGDIRDLEALTRATCGVDVLIHAAALKHVPNGELFPQEFIRTNIGGAEHIVSAAIANRVQHVIALSTSKAVAPLNLYGATKLCADKLFIQANELPNNQDTRFSILRLGNIFNSRGSVAPLFLKMKSGGVLPVTHPDMTRFSITMPEVLKLLEIALQLGRGGEIFIPKSPSYRIGDLAKAIGPSCKLEIIGLRPGEKMHEEMIVEQDAALTLEAAGYYLTAAHREALSELAPHHKAQAVASDFSYDSASNPAFLTVEDLRRLANLEAS